MDWLAGTCTKCGKGNTCVWESNATRSVQAPGIAEAYWASTYPVTDLSKFAGHSIWRCYSRKTCLGNNKCARGRMGRGCSQCLEGWHGKPDGECSPCSDMGTVEVHQ